LAHLIATQDKALEKALKERGLPLEEGVDGVTRPVVPEGEADPWPRPFDPSKKYLGKSATGVHVPDDPFGARNMYTSPINDVTPVEEQEKMLQMTRSASVAERKGLLGTKDVSTWMKKRHCVQTLDRQEQILKPHRVVEDRKPEYSHGLKRIDTEPIKVPKTLHKPQQVQNRPEDSKRPHIYVRPGEIKLAQIEKRKPRAERVQRASSVKVLPSSIHHHEPYHSDCPNVTFQTRCRANDADPPFNVQYGTFLPRSAEYGTRRGYMAGEGTAPRAPGLGPAPWRHTASGKKMNTYVADEDFERYRHPPTMITRNQKEDNPMYSKMVGREEYLHKTASRTALNILDHTRKNNTQKFRPEFRTGRVELEI
jgi:hypothetical protein